MLPEEPARVPPPEAPLQRSQARSEEPWPELEEGQAGAPAPGTPGRGARGSRTAAGTAFRVSFLLAGLFLVTVIGIAVGRSLTGSARIASPGVTSAASTTSTTATTTRPKTRPKAPAVHWGPLPVTAYGGLPAVGDLPAAAVSGKTLVVIGGVGSDSVLAGPLGGRLATVARLPRRLAAVEAFTLGGTVYSLGGEDGTSVSNAIYRIDPATRSAVPAGTFEEPLAEAGVAVVGRSAYLVGGWTGSQYASAILKFTPPGGGSLVARLPEGVRSPAVVMLGSTLYVAGGLTQQGLSRKVYAVDLATGTVKPFGTLPQGLEQGSLVVAPSGIFLVGGRGANGKPVDSVVRIDPVTGYAVNVGTTRAPLAGAATVPTGSRTLMVVAHAAAVYRLG